ncbi:CheR family methyltransferase [Oceanobacter kriegii]|uniref:CheR family methyltransferase n=1 Tax=Oceanobacter kriegii TaxID=64972 RepID=UPI000419FFC5|nr:chemotaxis protein CheB [Oceanobacter kriegii]
MNDENGNAPSHYIGIGASAGGLEALQEFFKHVPSDTGAAYIIAQHLSPDFKSMMPELLAKHTDMPIHQVSDGITVEANSIYLMPPRTNMLMAEGCLLLSEQMKDANVHHPIDIFLRSLAKDQHHNAIAIVLSGTGSDGTKGIQAMKESDGMVIIQEPGSAKFDGMPTSAYRTGLADLVLTPQEMGPNLVNYINMARSTDQGKSIRFHLNEAEETMSEIFRLLKDQSSINFSQYKASTVARRIERRLTINQLSSLDAYLRFLLESPKEIQILNKELLIGVTRFFRDKEAYDLIERDVVPKIVERAVKDKDNVRLWIAGCSTGEEAYSLAMLVDEHIRNKGYTCDVKVFATDVDEQAIVEASAGRYHQDIVQDIPEERLHYYFEPKGDTWVVSSRLRQMVIFAAHNMIEDPPFSNIDLISCRNVLIYFQHAAQKKVLASLYFSLKKDGYLFLGSSESLGELSTHFDTLNERAKIFAKVSNKRVPIGSAPPRRADGIAYTQANQAMAPVSTIFRPNRSNGKNQMSAILERILEQYAPNCVVLNDLFEAIHLYGDVSPYLKGIRPGRVSHNIKEMVNDELSIAISTALYRCEKDGEDVFYKDVVMGADTEHQHSIDISVLNVRDPEHSNSPTFYVLQFLPQSADMTANTNQVKVSFDATEQSRQRIRDLEQELVKKQEHLQVTIEELETTNEELQSANEELMSANEELQSTNEELQSVNEELYTVNSEYQEKISELTEVNSDLDSVMNATDIGIAFLDEHLTIRKFTPPTARYIHLRGTDIGRPFHHISHELDYPDFLNDIAKVSKGEGAIVKSTSAHNGHAVLVRILPYYKGHPQVVSGVLVTITNISRQQFIESELRRTQETLRKAMGDRMIAAGKEPASPIRVKVLLVDDDLVDRKLVRRLLNETDNREFIIDDFETAEDALDAAKREDFDVFLLDYRLADTTAADFAAQLRNQGIRTPIIVLSGLSDVWQDFDFGVGGIYDFLSKDQLSAPLLVRSIDYVIERHRMTEVIEGLS